jgi:hypothetical protein
MWLDLAPIQITNNMLVHELKVQKSKNALRLIKHNWQCGVVQKKGFQSILINIVKPKI